MSELYINRNLTLRPNVPSPSLYPGPVDVSVFVRPCSLYMSVCLCTCMCVCVCVCVYDEDGCVCPEMHVLIGVCLCVCLHSSPCLPPWPTLKGLLLGKNVAAHKVSTL